MSDARPLTKEPYLGSLGVVRNFLEDYRGNLVDFKVDAGVGNLLVTGRPNSGVEEFKQLLLSRLDEKGREYEEIVIVDVQSVFKAISALRTSSKLIVLDDPNRLLFSIGGLTKPQGLVYLTKHWNLRTDSNEYLVFDHHIAFASQRNQEIGDYPRPFAGIGSDLKKGEYVSISTGQFSMVSKTSIS
jgi:hypothetical protein